MNMRKIMLLGEIGVGKSSLVRRLVHDHFEEGYLATIGVDIVKYALRGAGPDGKLDLDLIVWDTDGNFGDSIFRHSYIKGAAAALIVGDATRKMTLEAMPRLARGFEETLPGRHCAFILNKIDLVPYPASQVLPEALGSGRWPLVRTSAKTGQHVKEAIVDVAATIIRRGL